MLPFINIQLKSYINFDFVQYCKYWFTKYDVVDIHVRSEILYTTTSFVYIIYIIT